MAQAPAGKEASTGHGVRNYERHRPEQTLLYRLVEQHYPEFADAMAAQGTTSTLWTPMPRVPDPETDPSQDVRTHPAHRQAPVSHRRCHRSPPARPSPKHA